MLDRESNVLARAGVFWTDGKSEYVPRLGRAGCCFSSGWGTGGRSLSLEGLFVTVVVAEACFSISLSLFEVISGDSPKSNDAIAASKSPEVGD